MSTAFMILANRQLLGGEQEDDSDESHCPTNYDDLSQADPILGDSTFHDIITYTAAACTVLTLLLGDALIVSQMFNYRVPRAQKHLIRIILTGPIFAIFSMAGVAAYRATHYMEALLGFYEVFTLYSLFMLCVAYLTPSTAWQSQLAFFHNPAYGGIKKFRWRYIRVVQVIPIRFVCALVTIIITASECWMDHSFRRINGIFTIIGTVSIIVAISGIFPFISRMSPELRKVDPQVINKLLAAKIIIVAEILLALIFNILSWTDSLEPSDTISYNDINVGMLIFATNCLSLITACIMLPFFRANQFAQKPWVVDFHQGSQGHHDTSVQDPPHNEGAGDYAIGNHAEPNENADSLLPLQSMQAMSKQSPWTALWDTVNVSDVFIAVWRAVRLFFTRTSQLTSKVDVGLASS